MKKQKQNKLKNNKLSTVEKILLVLGIPVFVIAFGWAIQEVCELINHLAN